jgi:acetylornithine deacetylase
VGENGPIMPAHGSTADRALALAAAGRARSVEALRELVRIPSLTGEEGEAQARVAAWLAELGAETHVAEPDVGACFERFPEIAQYPTHWQHDLILPYADLPTAAALRASGLEGVLNYRNRPNVVGVLRGAGGGRSLLLNGHVDTVTVEPRGAWTRDPFGAEVAGGLLYGRGASDMKGGLVAGLMALRYLREAGVRLAGDVIVQSVVNEEHAGNGTLDLVRRGWRADAAIVLEPTENRVAVSHPGGLYWQVTVPGVPRSPGARWEDGRQAGVSAIEKLPAIIEALLALEREERGHDSFALVIGKVAGGHYETVTAGEAVLRGGAYFAPAVGDVRAVMRRFREAVARAGEGDPFLRAHPPRLEFLHHDDATRQPADLPIAVHVGALLARRGGDGAVRPGPFACDMRHLVNQGGIPSIIFGPGTIAQAHKPDEHIPVQEYLDCVEHLVEIIATWCGAPVAAASDQRKEPVS